MGALRLTNERWGLLHDGGVSIYPLYLQEERGNVLRVLAETAQPLPASFSLFYVSQHNITEYVMAEVYKESVVQYNGDVWFYEYEIVFKGKTQHAMDSWVGGVFNE